MKYPVESYYGPSIMTSKPGNTAERLLLQTREAGLGERGGPSPVTRLVTGAWETEIRSLRCPRLYLSLLCAQGQDVVQGSVPIGRTSLFQKL